MFDIAWGELVVIGVVALIVIGPKELPGVLRAVGQWTTKIRRMASEFQSQFQEALREAEMADLKKEVDNLNTAARDVVSDLTPTFDDPLDPDPMKATKWEPKASDAKSIEAKPGEAGTADAKTAEAPVGSVTPDGYAASEASSAAQHAAVPPAHEEDFRPSVPVTPDAGKEASAPAAEGHQGGHS